MPAGSQHEAPSANRIRVLPGGNAVFPHKGPVESGVIGKAAQAAHRTGVLSPRQQLPRDLQPLPLDVLLDAGAHVLLEFVA